AVVALGLSAASSAAFAAEPEAAHVDVSFSKMNKDDDGTRFGLNSGFEYQLFPDYNLQLNSGANHFGESDETQGDLSAHLIFTPQESFATGAYLGYEGFDGYDAIFGGIEGRLDLGHLTAQTYFQIGEAENTEFRSWGASARYTVCPGLSLGVFFDDIELPGAIDVNRYGASLDYRLNNRFGLFAKLGGTETSGSGGSGRMDAEFVEIGARFLFGGNGRTTFDRRAAFGILPGG
nr:hypothetical protein [Planctomycetales bacterium]NIP67813.1 hypothetical protein [Planctomycetales bacterium]